MLEGRIGNLSGAPYVEARISFPQLGFRGLVSFLVDTGADGTVLMPADTKRLGIDFSSLRNPTTSEGIGGAARGFVERAVLSFSDRRYIYAYLLPIEVSAPTRYNLRFPSLLGRDILKQWRFVMDVPKQQVTFTPRTWKLRKKI